MNRVTFTTWIRAARLRTIPLSISGILVGSASAFLKDDLNVSVFTLAILTTICYQLLSNFANDYGDGVKGIDNDERLGPKRILQSELISRTQLRQVIFVISGVAVLLTILLVYSAFGLTKTALTFLGLGFFAIVAAIRYTVGSNAYGYKGLGDLFVFLFFGFVSVLGSHYLYTFELDLSLIFPAISIGLLSVGVLNVNNMRDRVNDKQFGKTTIAVRLGAKKAALYQLALVGTPSYFNGCLRINLPFHCLCCDVGDYDDSDINPSHGCVSKTQREKLRPRTQKNCFADFFLCYFV